MEEEAEGQSSVQKVFFVWLFVQDWEKPQYSVFTAPPPPPTLLFVESLCLYSNKPTDVSQCTNPRFPLNGIKKNLPDLTLADLNTDSVYGPWIPCYSVTHMYVLTTGSIDQRPRAWLKRKKKRSAWSTKAPLHHSEHRMHLPATGVLL